MLAFLVRGGIVMIPIAALSVVALALIIERIVFFMRIRDPSVELGAYVIEQLRNGNGGKVYMELQQKNSPEARVLLAGLIARKEGQNGETISLRMESQALKSSGELERNISFLGSIANLATLLGLLGTVSGMLHAFLNLKISGISDPARLAGGISEALITTVAGLCVAIPCLLCFQIFRQFVNRALSRMEIASSELLSLFAKEKQLKLKV